MRKRSSFTKFVNHHEISQSVSQHGMMSSCQKLEKYYCYQFVYEFNYSNRSSTYFMCRQESSVKNNEEKYGNVKRLIILLLNATLIFIASRNHPWTFYGIIGRFYTLRLSFDDQVLARYVESFIDRCQSV